MNFFLGHVHTGNIILSEGHHVLLTEIENYFFGGSSFLRNYAISLKGPSSSLVAFDIYSIGHVVHEMATGYPLEAPVCDGKLPEDLPDEISKCYNTIRFKLNAS